MLLKEILENGDTSFTALAACEKRLETMKEGESKSEEPIMTLEEVVDGMEVYDTDSTIDDFQKPKYTGYEGIGEPRQQNKTFKFILDSFLPFFLAADINNVDKSLLVMKMRAIPFCKRVIPAGLENLEKFKGNVVRTCLGEWAYELYQDFTPK